MRVTQGLGVPTYHGPKISAQNILEHGCVNIESIVALLKFSSLLPYWAMKIAINGLVSTGKSTDASWVCGGQIT